MNYRLYVRWPGQKRFAPVNWKEGKQVVNLTYASLFTEAEVQLLKQDLEQTKEHNKGMEYEIRRAT